MKLVGFMTDNVVTNNGDKYIDDEYYRYKCNILWQTLLSLNVSV